MGLKVILSRNVIDNQGKTRKVFYQGASKFHIIRLGQKTSVYYARAIKELHQQSNQEPSQTLTTE